MLKADCINLPCSQYYRVKELDKFFALVIAEKHIRCGHIFRLPHVSFSPGPRAPVKTETGEVKRMQPGKSNATGGRLRKVERILLLFVPSLPFWQ